MIGWILAASAMACLGEPVTAHSQWLVTYAASGNRNIAKSAAVPLNDPSLLVTVVTPGATPAQSEVWLNKRAITTDVIGFDSVSRLAFLKIEGGAHLEGMKWRNDASGMIGARMRAIAAEGPKECRATGWIKQFGTKVLPLALLQVSFTGDVPPPGTPLVDTQGRVVAIVFQASANGNVGYAIPAEAVHRVKRDLVDGGSLRRGWLGVSLNAESKSPKVVKVLPGSPAAIAGIKPNDVLLAVGSRQITEYADAADAFFYLVPGQPVRVKLRRGTNPLEITVTPTRPQAE